MSVIFAVQFVGFLKYSGKKRKGGEGFGQSVCGFESCFLGLLPWAMTFFS